MSACPTLLSPSALSCQVIRYTAPPLAGTLKRLRVSRTFYSTLYCVKQKALQRLAQGVRTNLPDKFSKRTGFRDSAKRAAAQGGAGRAVTAVKASAVAVAGRGRGRPRRPVQ